MVVGKYRKSIAVKLNTTTVCGILEMMESTAVVGLYFGVVQVAQIFTLFGRGNRRGRFVAKRRLTAGKRVVTFSLVSPIEIKSRRRRKKKFETKQI